MSGILDQILKTKRGELPALREAPLPAPPVPRPVSLKRRPGQALNLICEIKQRSPSAGELSGALSIAERATAYERGGASAISVLCDREYFGGAYEHISRARAGASLPILCKEFVIDEIQLDHAHAAGSSLVLLIVRCLPQPLLEQMIRRAVARDLLPLVEVANSDESARAMAAGAQLIGVNARDLHTLKMDVEGARQILERLPPEVVAVHLSGLKSAADVAQIAGGRADAALIGEALMRADDPEPLLREMSAAAQQTGGSPHRS